MSKQVGRAERKGRSNFAEGVTERLAAEPSGGAALALPRGRASVFSTDNTVKVSSPQGLS
ncbi:MAG: hypothetical protein EOO15_21530 [Chitinophagaceae bacterium]|nr:MAG: hypothetical protein EOO15_21530 [Chitinophagaceae bacterium]